MDGVLELSSGSIHLCEFECSVFCGGAVTSILGVGPDVDGTVGGITGVSGERASEDLSSGSMTSDCSSASAPL